MNLKPFVKISGQGPAIVLLHGWGLHGGIWETIFPTLEQQFTVYNIDLPGFGYSPVHNGDYTLEYLTESVAAIMPENSNLIGWSLGGLVATNIALQCPEKVASLVTVASNPCFVASDDWPGMTDSVLESFIEFLEEDFEGTLIKFLGIQTMGSATQKEDIKRLKETVFIHGQPSKKAMRGGLQILKLNDLTSRISDITQPFLRLYGRRDSLVPAKVAKQVDSLAPNSQSHTFRQSAHAPFLSCQEEFIEVIESFLFNNKKGAANVD